MTVESSSGLPTFSVVICTYNRAGLLPRAIDSVLGQTWRDLELVVVDDGSTDDTRAVVAGRADARLRYVHQENHGLGGARVTGLASCTGRYVAFLDDDDLALDSWLERLAGALDDDCALVCCGELIADDDGRVLGTKLPASMGPAFDDFEALLLAGTFAVRRDVLEAVGGFLPDLRRMQWTELALRLLPECSRHGWTVRSVPEPLVQLHVHRVETSRHGFPVLLDAMEHILDRHAAQLGRSPSALAQYRAIAGVAAARTGDLARARFHLRRAVRARPGTWKHWGRLALATVPPIGRRVWRVPPPSAPRAR